MKIGYARVSTAQQDLTAQVETLAGLGFDADRIYTDQGLTGSNRDLPGLAKAMAAARSGDVFVVAKFDRLARSIRDAHDIADELAPKGVVLSIGSSAYGPTDPDGKLPFNVLAMVAEFETDIIRARTREGMTVAKAKGRPRGKKPKLLKTPEKHLVELWRAGAHTSAELVSEFGVARSTVYRAVDRAGQQ